MTNEHRFDRKKLIILRAVLILIGGAVGATALWQYFLYYPNVVKREFAIVITVVSSVVFAAILGLSAKPFYRLGESIGAAIGTMLSHLGARGVIAVMLGLVSAGLFVFLTDVIIRASIDIWAVRLLTDVLVYILFAALCCYGFTKWLVAPDELLIAPPPSAGFLLSAECFNDDRVFTAACVLTKAKVCDGAYKALSLYSQDGGVRAIERLEKLVKLGIVELVRCGNGFSGIDEYRAAERYVAENKRYKYVVTGGAGELDRTTALDMFAAPSQGLLQKLDADIKARGDEPNAEQKSDALSSVDGQIIIDK